MGKQSVKEHISSKKFVFVICSVWVMFAFAYIAAKHLSAMIPMFDTFVGGVLGLAGLYLTGNVANKWVLSKGSKSAPTPPVEPAPEESSPENSPK